MPKINYFDSLERLGVLCNRAVFLACGAGRPTNEAVTLRASADKIICELEKTLFCDFMPPLERASIAECAHSLGRIMDKCTEISNHRGAKCFGGERKNKEAELCIRLAQSIEENIFRLRKIKRPEELPDFLGFRKLIFEARTAHALLLRKMNAGVYPRAAIQSAALIGQLRCELAHCFDDIIEIMLNNI